MPLEVVLTAHAEQDLELIYRYVAEYESRPAADHVLERLGAAAESLAVAPERGSVPRELRGLGVTDYRQAFFKPYRLIYRVSDQRIIVHLIADGRRDLASLLARRLLGG
jgi:toxin ParE1/3/4